MKYHLSILSLFCKSKFIAVGTLQTAGNFPVALTHLETVHMWVVVLWHVMWQRLFDLHARTKVLPLGEIKIYRFVNKLQLIKSTRFFTISTEYVRRVFFRNY
jgi:hypothetical protein